MHEPMRSSTGAAVGDARRRRAGISIRRCRDHRLRAQSAAAALVPILLLAACGRGPSGTVLHISHTLAALSASAAPPSAPVLPLAAGRHELKVTGMT